MKKLLFFQIILLLFTLFGCKQSGTNYKTKDEVKELYLTHTSINNLIVKLTHTKRNGSFYYEFKMNKIEDNKYFYLYQVYLETVYEIYGYNDSIYNVNFDQFYEYEEMEFAKYSFIKYLKINYIFDSGFSFYTESYDGKTEYKLVNNKRVLVNDVWTFDYSNGSMDNTELVIIESDDKIDLMTFSFTINNESFYYEVHFYNPIFSLPSNILEKFVNND